MWISGTTMVGYGELVAYMFTIMVEFLVTTQGLSMYIIEDMCTDLFTDIL
ncbi:hypothetical protein MACH07_28100 [Flagellimonas marinaquae]|uniref:Uncharacterized protein n=1 Tax=Flagellimonas marinaquae TaxID=254955 RepID=A0AA48KPK8_9FLAO|nr:hypothetical protein MACH07_28100 [Allomuricauda aquimarina]